MKKTCKSIICFCLTTVMAFSWMGISTKAVTGGGNTQISAAKYGQCRYTAGSTTWNDGLVINTAYNNSATSRGDGSVTAEYTRATNAAQIVPAVYYDLSTVDKNKRISCATITFSVTNPSYWNTTSLDLYAMDVTSKWTDGSTFEEYEKENDSAFLNVILGNKKDDVVATTERVPNSEAVSESISFDITRDLQARISEGSSYAGYAVFFTNLESNGKIQLGTGNTGPVLTVEYTTEYDLTIDGDPYKAPYNAKVALKTPENNDAGQVFSHWEKNGNIVSYSREYTFYAFEDATIVPVYADAKPETKSCYYIAYNKDDDGNLNYYIELTYPEGSTGNRCYFGATIKMASDSTNTNKANGKYAVLTDALGSGTSQYKVSLGNAASFDATQYTESRIKIEFGNKDKTGVGGPQSKVFWFAENGTTKTGTDWIDPVNFTGTGYLCGVY
ncbi:MAG: hypothetical protein ACI4CT_08745 [Lachnospiraceae bacterium]